VDGDTVPPLPETPHKTVLVHGDFLPEHPFDRVAMLRDLAAATCTADYLAFLDDDNEWEPDHLGQLLDTIDSHGPAAHSWRTLVSPAGEPVTVDCFPWQLPSEQAVARLTALCGVGVMSRDSAVVRDRTVIDGVEGLPGMVDLGEWLFRRDLLRLLRFHRRRSPDEVTARHGEDDTILEQLAELGVPVGCSRRATLRYRLGGMSNPESQTAEGPA
jgi:hypothetical protein